MWSARLSSPSHLAFRQGEDIGNSISTRWRSLAAVGASSSRGTCCWPTHVVALAADVAHGPPLQRYTMRSHRRSASNPDARFIRRPLVRTLAQHPERMHLRDIRQATTGDGARADAVSVRSRSLVLATAIGRLVVCVPKSSTARRAERGLCADRVVAIRPPAAALPVRLTRLCGCSGPFPWACRVAPKVVSPSAGRSRRKMWWCVLGAVFREARPPLCGLVSASRKVTTTFDVARCQPAGRWRFTPASAPSDAPASALKLAELQAQRLMISAAADRALSSSKVST